MNPQELLPFLTAELRAFFEPLAQAVRQPKGPYRLCARLGWDIDGVLTANLAPFKVAVNALLDGIPSGPELVIPPGVEAGQAAIDAAHQCWLEAQARLPAIEAALTVQLGQVLEEDAQLAVEFSEDLAHHLLVTYLAWRQPLLWSTARALGVVVEETATELITGTGSARVVLRHPIRRSVLRTNAIEGLASNPLAILVGPGGTPSLPDLGEVIRHLVMALMLERGRARLDAWSLEVEAGLLRLRDFLPGLSSGATWSATLPIGGVFAPRVTWGSNGLELGWDAGLAGDITLFEEAGVSVVLPRVGDALRGWGIESSNGALQFVAAGQVLVRLPGDLLAAADGSAIEIGLEANLSCTPGALPRFACNGAVAVPPLKLGSTFELAGASIVAADFALPFDAAGRLSAAGHLAVPGGSVAVHVELSAGGLSVRSMAELEFAGGVRLSPIGDAPVLSAQLRASDGRLACNVQAQLILPGDQAIAMSGQLVLTPAGIDHVSVAGTTSQLTLPGDVVLRDATVELAVDDELLVAHVAGDLQPPGFESPVHVGGRLVLSAGAVRLEAAASVSNLRLHEHLCVFDGELSVWADSAAAAGRVELRNAAAGLARLATGSQLGASGYELAVEELEARFHFSPDGFSLACTRGRILLPSLFSPADEPDERAFVAVDQADAGGALVFSWSSPPNGSATIAFSGRLDIGPIGVRFGEGTDALEARIEAATLAFDIGATPPVRLSGVSGFVALPMPGERQLVLGFDDIEWDLAGLPIGEIELREDAIFSLGDDADPICALTFVAPASEGGPGTRLSVSRTTAGDTEFEIAAQLSVLFSTELLADESGGEVEIETSGAITISSNPATEPRVAGLELTLSGSFRLGDAAQGLRVKRAAVAFLHVERLFDSRDRDDGREPLEITLAGEVALHIAPARGGADAPSLVLEETSFRFEQGLDAPPIFHTAGLRLSSGSGIFFGLLSFERAGILLIDAERALPDALHPSNLRLVIDELTLNVQVKTTGIAAGVEGLELELHDGTPLLVINGIEFGVDGLTLPSMTLSGALHLSGFRDFPHLKLAGVLGASSSGTGVRVLYAQEFGFGETAKAFEDATKSFAGLFARPMGAAFDLSVGPAGIPVGQTGILITGASGGVSFQNTNADPTKFASYADPTEFVSDLDSEDQVPVEADAPMELELTLPSDRPSSALGCLCECPPPAMNVFCQPHPDRERNRAILKFSSLDEAFLEGILIPSSVPNGDGSLDFVSLRDFLEAADLAAGTGDDAAEIEEVKQALKDAGKRFTEAAAVEFGKLTNAATEAGIGAAVNLFGEELSDELKSLLSKPEEYWRAGFDAALDAAIEQHVRPGVDRPPLYELVRDVAAAGLPCPDLTLQVTGNVSYLGVSSFVTITGGVNLSTSGSVGVLGSLNVMGIPLGTLRAFLTFTSAAGNPDPSLCGDLRFAVGPLEFGNVNFTCACPGFVVEVSKHALDFVGKLGEPLMERLIDATAPWVKERVGYVAGDPSAALALLTHEEASGLVARMLSASVGLWTSDELERIDACLLQLLARTWDSFQPEIVLCGEVEPKFFGITLAKGVNLEGWATKEALGASVGFSPGILIGGWLGAGWSVIGQDSAEIAMQCELPRLDDLVALGLTGRIRTGADFIRALDDGFERFLSRAAITFSYEMSPLGMKLVNAQGRVLLPDLAHHPATPHSGWKRPEARGGGLKSRVEVLREALARERLADPSWAGGLGELFPDVADMAEQRLLQDYFPHGGFIGAAAMLAPKLLTGVPPLDKMRLALDPQADQTKRLQAALEIVQWLGSGMEQVGEFYFYVPAPNPPTFAVDGRALTPRELARQLLELQLPEGPLEMGAAYAIEESLLGASWRGTLLGVPLGEARLEFVPPQSGADGVARVSVTAPEGSWVSMLAGAVKIAVELRVAWPSTEGTEVLTIAAGTQALAERLRAMIDETIDDAETADLTDFDFASELGRILPRVSLDARLDMAQLKLPPELADIVQLVNDADAWLRAYSPGWSDENDESTETDESTESSESNAEDWLSLAQRNGGIVLQAHGRIGAGFGLDIDLPQFTAQLEPSAADTWPRIRAKVGLDAVRVIPDWPVLRDVSVTLDSAPNAGEPILDVSGTVEGSLPLGGLELRGLDGHSFTINWRWADDAGVRYARVEVDPVELRVPILGGAMVFRVHGESPESRFTIQSRGLWQAHVTVESASGSPLEVLDLTHRPLLLLTPPNDQDVPEEQRVPWLEGVLTCEGYEWRSLEIFVRAKTTITAWPQAQGLTQKLTLSGESSIVLQHDGTFAFEGEWSPLSIGVFSIHGAKGRDVNIAARFTQAGFSVPSGAALSIGALGYGDGLLRLKQFEILANGDFEAHVQSGRVSLTDHFELQAGEIVLSRHGNATRLHVHLPSATFFTGSLVELTLPPGPQPSERRSGAPHLPPFGDRGATPGAIGFPDLSIESTGRFHLAIADQTIVVPGLFAASGSLEIGYLPPPQVASKPATSSDRRTNVPGEVNLLRNGDGALGGPKSVAEWEPLSGEWACVQTDGELGTAQDEVVIAGRASGANEARLRQQVVLHERARGGSLTLRGKAGRRANGGGELVVEMRSLRLGMPTEDGLRQPVSGPIDKRLAAFEHRLELLAEADAVQVELVVTGVPRDHGLGETLAWFDELELHFQPAVERFAPEFGPYAWVRNGELKIAPLPGGMRLPDGKDCVLQLDGEARITRAGAHATLKGGALAVPGLEIDATRWRANYVAGAALEVEGDSPGVRVLGFGVAPRTKLALRVEATGAVNAAVELGQDLVLVPGIFELTEGTRFDLSVDNRGFGEVGIGGHFRVLPAFDRMAVPPREPPRHPLQESIANGPFRIVLFDTNDVAQVLDRFMLPRLPGQPLEGRLVFSRDATGDLSLAVEDVQLRFLPPFSGLAFRGRAELSLGGLMFQLDAPPELSFGPISLVPQANQPIRLFCPLPAVSPANLDFQLHLPQLTVSSTIPGWPPITQKVGPLVSNGRATSFVIESSVGNAKLGLPGLPLTLEVDGLSLRIDVRTERVPPVVPSLSIQALRVVFLGQNLLDPPPPDSPPPPPPSPVIDANWNVSFDLPEFTIPIPGAPVDIVDPIVLPLANLLSGLVG